MFGFVFASYSDYSRNRFCLLGFLLLHTLDLFSFVSLISATCLGQIMLPCFPKICFYAAVFLFLFYHMSLQDAFFISPCRLAIFFLDFFPFCLPHDARRLGLLPCLSFDIFKTRLGQWGVLHPSNRSIVHFSRVMVLASLLF